MVTNKPSAPGGRPSTSATVLICQDCRSKSSLPPGEPARVEFVCPVCRKPASSGERVSPSSHPQKKQEEGWLQTLFAPILAWLSIGAFFGALWLGAHVLYTTWPVCPFFFVAGFGWWYARRSEGPFAKATEDVLLPISLGLLALCLALLVLNTSQEFFDRSWPYRVEDQLVHAELKLREALELSLPAFLAILLVLIGVNHFFPKWRVVTRFLKIRDLGSKLSIALLAVTSFTLGSHAMIQTWSRDAHQSLEGRYRASLQKTQAAMVREKAAVALQPIVKRMDARDLQAFKALFHSLREHGLDQDSEVVRKIIHKRVDTAEKQAEVASYLKSVAPERKESAESLLPEPASESEWRRQEQQVRAAEKGAEEERVRAEQAMTGLRSVFVEIVGAGLPGFGDFADSYLEGLLDAWSEEMTKRIAEHLPAKIEGLPGKIAFYLIRPEPVTASESTGLQTAEALVVAVKADVDADREKAKIEEQARQTQIEMRRIEEFKAREAPEVREFRVP